MKRIVTIFLMIVLCFQLLPLSAFAGNVNHGILGELADSTIGGKAFDLNDYPKKDGASAELFSFMETGYAFNGNQSQYCMYVYVYNPSEKIIVESGNMITMAVKFDGNGVAEDFEKFDLIFLEKTENNRFYKFAVEDHVSAVDYNKIVQRVNKDERRYTVSEIEMKYLGSSAPTASLVGKSFVFTGFEENENLAVKTNLVETVELDVKSTYWRSQTSSLGIGHQNQLTSVYFSVPNELIEKYGYLQAITALWNEQKTTPILVVDNKEFADGLQPWLGVEIAEENENCAYSFYDIEAVPNLNSVSYLYRYIFNEKKPWHILSSCWGKRLFVLGYTFYSSDVKKVGAVGVSGKDLSEYIQKCSYADWLFEDSVDMNRVKGQQQHTIYADKLFDLDTFGDTNNWFTVFLNFGFSYKDAYEDLKEIAPIYEVKAEDVLLSKTSAQISSSLYVAENDVDEIRSAYNEASANDETLFLFRFAATDYYAEDISDFFIDGKEIDCNGYIAQETVFLGFDVISLTFFDDHVSTVIPVAASPIDIVPDITNPYIPEKDNSWKRILMLIFLVVILILCWNPLMKILGWVIDLIMDIMKEFKYTRPKKRRRKRK